MRVVLVTGAGSGFGAGCVRAFAAPPCSARGDRVVATMRDPAQHPFGDHASIDVRALDVTDAASIASCVSSVIRDHGRIDVLVNSAGIHFLGAMEDMDEAALRQVFETNFFGAVNVARAVLPHMRARGQGHIISISSIGAKVGRVIDGAYCASKAALEIAMEAMHSEVARFGVQVSVVSPGAYRTGIGRHIGADDGGRSPYRGLQAFRGEKVQAAVDQGDDPAEVAKLIVEIADDPHPDFRTVVGERALEIDRTLAGLGDAERQALLARLADIGWWIDGKTRPQ